jgi:hypothetical protein
MTALSTLSPITRTYLDDFIVRSRRVALLRRLAMALCVFLMWAIVCCIVDRFAHLPGIVRLAALCAGIIALAVLVTPSLLAFRRRADWKSVAVEIERQNPRFGQRLITVTSRVLGAATYRGSDEILLRLVREVDDEVTAEGSRNPAAVRGVVAPSAVLILLAVSIAGLWQVPALKANQLATRFMLPLEDIPPVTTTQLVVLPGDHDVLQSQPLTIEVRTEQLGDSPVDLYLNEDNRNWSRVVMNPAGDNRFVFTLAAVDRDLHYYVTGGDARSPDHLIRVLRRPAVEQFTIRYEYPPYTHIAQSVVTNTDGRIEAPAGTKVSLTITATEPLQAALLTIGSDRSLMQHTGDAASREAAFTVKGDAPYLIDLISTRDVAGSAPSTAFIHAIPDLPPQVRLGRGGDTLHLNPRDIIPVSYEAIDDYGLKTIELRAEVNGQAPVTTPLHLKGDPRRQHDTFNLDLATLPLGIGDMVTLTAEATDTAGHVAESEPLRIAISPRSVDLDSYERMLELYRSAELSRSLSAALDDAIKAITEADGAADHQSNQHIAAAARGDRALGAASQTGTLLRQSLLRAITHDRRPALAIAMANWVDDAEVASATADEAFRREGAGREAASSETGRLQHAAEQSRQLQARLTTVVQGEQAAAVLADHQNLVAVRARPPLKDEASRRRQRETLERMRQDFVAETKQAGFDPVAGDLDQQLQSRIKAEDEFLKDVHPVDFNSALHEWASRLKEDPRQRLGMEGRLWAAAQAEAIRPDADLPRARDLDLASRAVAAITAYARNAKSAGGAIPEQFVTQWEILERLRSPQQASSNTQSAGIRQWLTRVAENPDPKSGTSKPGLADAPRKEAERLALAASAAAAEHEYHRAAELDQMLDRRLSAPPSGENATTQPETGTSSGNEAGEHHEQAVRREMETAHRLDDLGQEQQNLLSQAGNATSAELVGRQKDVAERIAGVAMQAAEDNQPMASVATNGREQGASEVLAVQEELSVMPEALAAAQAAGVTLRETATRAQAARQVAKDAAPAQREAANRAADQAAETQREAGAQLTTAMTPVLPPVARRIAERLEVFAPETDGATAVITSQLVPALESLQKSIGGDDSDAVGRAAAAAREAIEAAQRELATAQDELLRRDPLTAARWFARAAADSLSLSPPDIGHAKLRQQSASSALSRAWDQSIHRAAFARLSAVPSMEAVLDPATSVGGHGTKTVQQETKFPAAREWERLRPQESAEINAAMHESDPPGYEESLRLYFEALGKAQASK